MKIGIILMKMNSIKEIKNLDNNWVLILVEHKKNHLENIFQILNLILKNKSIHVLEYLKNVFKHKDFKDYKKYQQQYVYLL